MSSEAKKRAGSDGERPTKRPKAESMDPSSNPYLAHIYDGSQNDAGMVKGGDGDSILNSFERRNTTAEQAMKAEDGPNNPFSGKPLSNQYFKILETRRNLPVHAQR
jgi:pre-mRNA-splicing factor ATP-dependent RNA helicase DHX15/PRP43